MSEFKSKFNFSKVASELSFQERDQHIMIILLKIFVVLYKKGRPLVSSRWDKFFNAIHPEGIYTSKKYKTSSVPAVGIGLKWLIEQKLVNQECPADKQYKLNYLNKDKIADVLKALENNTQEYDDLLLEDINRFIEEVDSPPTERKSKYTTTEEAYLAIFASKDDIDY